jgi:hypothetical protein
MLLLDSGFCLEPVFQTVKGHGQDSSAVKIPETSKTMRSQRKYGRVRGRKPPKITHNMNKQKGGAE